MQIAEKRWHFALIDIPRFVQIARRGQDVSGQGTTSNTRTEIYLTLGEQKANIYYCVDRYR